MSLYFGATEITGLYFGDTEITGLYFGDTEIWAAWAEYDGILPATYSANGSTLADYRIYGAAGGVGDKTDNLFDPNAADIETGCYYNATGVKVQNIYHNESGFIPVSPGEYTFSFLRNASGSTFYVNFYDVNKNFVSNLTTLSGDITSRTVTIQDSGYVRFNFADYFIVRVMFYRGSGLSWVPYGYEVDMSVSDGTTSTTTPIYIGSDPLNANGGYADYVDYQSQKIKRRIKTRIFDGSETFKPIPQYSGVYQLPINDHINDSWTIAYSSNYYTWWQWIANGGGYGIAPDKSLLGFRNYGLYIKDKDYALAADFKNHVKELYDAGTPLTVTYVTREYYDTDPPVPFPALPTVDGVNIVDYAGQSAAPSRFYAKYRKEGF